MCFYCEDKPKSDKDISSIFEPVRLEGLARFFERFRYMYEFFIDVKSDDDSLGDCVEEVCNDLSYLNGLLDIAIKDSTDSDLIFECEMTKILVGHVIDDFRGVINGCIDISELGDCPLYRIAIRTEKQFLDLFKSLRKIKKARG